MARFKKVKNKNVKSVCYRCGVSANVVTCLKKFNAPPRELAYRISTWHQGECDFCHNMTEVTEPRDFFYPDFELLQSMPSVFEDAWKYSELG